MGIGKILLFLLASYILATLVLYIFQRNFIYFPSRSYVSPSQAHAHKIFKEISITTEDGLNLKGWYAAAKPKRFTIVFFHGNGDNLSSVASIADPYIAAGYGFLLTEYRGYSGLPGSPTETGLYADARAFLQALIASGVGEEDLILFAHSLGTGVAVQMATEFHVGGLILLAPFLSVAIIAQARFPIFPVELLILDRYENFKKAAAIKTPLLIAHGAKDASIPVSDGRQLYGLANEQKEFHLFPEGEHNNLLDLGFVPLSLSWLERLNSA